MFRGRSADNKIHLKRGTNQSFLRNSADGSSFSLELVGVSAAGAAATYSAQVAFSVTADTAQAVAANAASAINAISNFTSDGNFAVDNGDGTVTIQWASSDTVNTQAVNLSADATMGISLSGVLRIKDMRLQLIIQHQK